MNIADRRRMTTLSRSTQLVLKNILEFDLIQHFMFKAFGLSNFRWLEKQEKKKKSSNLRCNSKKSLPIESGCSGALQNQP